MMNVTNGRITEAYFIWILGYFFIIVKVMYKREKNI